MAAQPPRIVPAPVDRGDAVEVGAFGERRDDVAQDAGQYRGAMKDLPDTARPPLPPGVPGGGHGGSHGQLSNELVTAILEDRQPAVNGYEALSMTVPGIIAHQSALKDGETLKVPQYDPPES